jgi:hypothetical protein
LVLIRIRLLPDSFTGIDWSRSFDVMESSQHAQVVRAAGESASQIIPYGNKGKLSWRTFEERQGFDRIF